MSPCAVRAEGGRSLVLEEMEERNVRRVAHGDIASIGVTGHASRLGVEELPAGRRGAETSTATRATAVRSWARPHKPRAGFAGGSIYGGPRAVSRYHGPRESGRTGAFDGERARDAWRRGYRSSPAAPRPRRQQCRHPKYFRKAPWFGSRRMITI